MNEDFTSYKAFFAGKKITVMGLGLLGRGVGDVAFLAGLGATLIVTDLKSKKELAPSLAKLSRFKNISFVLGQHRKKDFTSADMVIKAAGVPLNSLYISAAEKAGVPVYMSSALFTAFAKEKGVTVVGITGTRGKSTVTHLVHHILTVAKHRVHLGGNVRGVSTLALLPKIKTGDVAILELDSWQMQGFHTLKISPRISVFTSFMEDHLNYYGGSMQNYFEDKAAVYRYQDANDIVISGPSATSYIRKELKKVGGKYIAVRGSDVPKSWKRLLIGSHNDENYACAISVARALGVSETTIKKAVASFKPLSGRLELISSVRGVRIINDNNATTPTATAAALSSLASAKARTILIMGGADKTLSFEPLAQILQKTKTPVVLLPGSGTDAFLKIHRGGSVLVTNLKDALYSALALAKKGDTVLFSPACASFGLFKNEYDRNDQFVQLVKKLK